MMKLLHSGLIAFVAMLILAAGCREQRDSDTDMKLSDVDSTMSNTEGNRNRRTSMNQDDDMQPTAAIAVIHPTKGNNAKGTITFNKGSEGIQVHADFTGLPQGKHGFHIHLYGDCSADDGTSAGTHFNFEGSSKNPPSDIDRITGNLGNLMAGSNGSATADTLIKNAVMGGNKSIIGRAVIVHAKGNDPSQPPIGAAGARLGCGVIGIANSDAMMNDNK